MNALIMGLPFGADASVIRLYRSRRGHEVRFLNIGGDADCRFDPAETATEVVERISRDWPVDLFVCWCPEMFPPPCDIERCPIKTAAIISDWNIYFPQLEYNLARYDMVFSDRLGSQTLPLYKTTPEYLFPLYAQRTPTHRPLGLQKDLDVVFVGNLNHAIHAERGRCLEKMAALSDRYRILITGGKEPEEYAELLNRARIVVNHSLRSEMNLRCFETLACGSVLFLEESNLEARDYLRDGIEVVFYNEKTLQGLLKQYLSNPALLDTLSANGLALAPRLAGEVRLDDLLDWMITRPMRERPFCTLSEPERALANVLQYATSLAAPQRIWARDLLNAARAMYPRDWAFTVAHAASVLEQAPQAQGDERRALTRDALACFHEVASAVPDAAPVWMNMAFVARLAGAADAERQFLEHVLRSDGVTFGNLLLGRVSDPYYVAWRRALAFGEAHAGLLHAAAAARLAEMALLTGDDTRARAYARKASAAEPGIAPPYRVQAQAMLRLGNVDAAIELLEVSLPLTAFDVAHRTLLLDAYLQAGCLDKAAVLADESARLFSACPEHQPYAAELSKLATELAG